MRSLARRALGGVLAAAFAVAAVCPAYARDANSNTSHELQVAAAGAIPKPVATTRILGTRFVIGLDSEVNYQVFSLSKPNRVVIELPEVDVRLPALDNSAPMGLVKTFRAGLAAPGKTRVVIDVTQPVVVENSQIVRDPDGRYRLSIAILPASAVADPSRKGASAAPVIGSTGLQPPVPRRAESPKERAAKAFKPIIVLDPGHGGDDSGAEKYGTVEKNVVLAFGLVLRDLLEKTGRYKVLMTRDDDTFVPLDQRTAYAERHKASLFIAIHADYSDQGSRARGATIYSLRDGVAKSLERSAKGNSSKKILSEDEIDTVKSVNGDVDTVKDILADLANRDLEMTHERTGTFAKTVIETMGESTPLRSEPEQQAAFRVLKTAQFPSVLIELAYVTNRDDANNLKSNQWREKVANSILSAIDSYFSRDIARLPM